MLFEPVDEMLRMSPVPAGDTPAEPGAEGRPRPRGPRAPAPRPRAHVQGAHAAPGEGLATVRT